MGSIAVVGGAGTGIYFLVDRKDGEKVNTKPGPQVTTPTTTTETTTPITTPGKEPATN